MRILKALTAIASFGLSKYFERIYEGEILAKNQDGEIISKHDGNIFMPLYQKEGRDGFFIIEPVD